MKPGNVLVGAGDQAKISDFGIARMAGDPQLTSTGLLTGTLVLLPELPAAPTRALSPTCGRSARRCTPRWRAPRRTPRSATRSPCSRRSPEPPPRPTNAGPMAEPIARMMDRDPRSRWAMADAAHALRRVAERGRERIATATVPLATDEAHDPTTTASPRPVAAPVAAAPVGAPPERRRRKACPLAARRGRAAARGRGRLRPAGPERRRDRWPAAGDEHADAECDLGRVPEAVALAVSHAVSHADAEPGADPVEDAEAGAGAGHRGGEGRLRGWLLRRDARGHRHRLADARTEHAVGRQGRVRGVLGPGSSPSRAARPPPAPARTPSRP